MARPSRSMSVEKVLLNNTFWTISAMPYYM
jgi:hypothetical protein